MLTGGDINVKRYHKLILVGCQQGGWERTADLPPVLLKVTAGGLLVQRMEPFYLREPAPGGPEVGQIHRAGLVVVRQVPELPPVGSDLDDCEGGIRKAGNPRLAPLLGPGWRTDCSHHRKDKREPESRATGHT